MTESTSATTIRVGSDGKVESTPTDPATDVVVAEIPGANPDNFVSITLSNPLNKRDREYLGLPADASTEVGQRLRVSKNGAKAIVHAGYATVDPEDRNALRNLVANSTPEDSAVDAAPVVPVEEVVAVEPVAEEVAATEVKEAADESTTRRRR